MRACVRRERTCSTPCARPVSGPGAPTTSYGRGASTGGDSCPLDVDALGRASWALCACARENDETTRLTVFLCCDVRFLASQLHTMADGFSTRSVITRYAPRARAARRRVDGAASPRAARGASRTTTTDVPFLSRLARRTSRRTARRQRRRASATVFRRRSVIYTPCATWSSGFPRRRPRVSSRTAVRLIGVDLERAAGDEAPPDNARASSARTARWVSTRRPRPARTRSIAFARKTSRELRAERPDEPMCDILKIVRTAGASTERRRATRLEHASSSSSPNNSSFQLSRINQSINQSHTSHDGASEGRARTAVGGRPVKARREARLKVRASRADVASDVAYRLVPARIDVDVGTDCEDARAKRASDASTSDASSSVRAVAPGTSALDHTASTVSYAEEQRLLVTTSAPLLGARRGRIGHCRGLAR